MRGSSIRMPTLSKRLIRSSFKIFPVLWISIDLNNKCSVALTSCMAWCSRAGFSTSCFFKIKFLIKIIFIDFKLLNYRMFFLNFHGIIEWLLAKNINIRSYAVGLSRRYGNLPYSVYCLRCHALIEFNCVTSKYKRNLFCGYQTKAGNFSRCTKSLWWPPIPCAAAGINPKFF